MAAYAEGLNVLAPGRHRPREPRQGRRDRAAHPPAVLPVRPRPAGDHRGVAAGQRGRVVAARSHRRRVRRRPAARRVRRAGQRLRRGPLDRPGRDRRRACRCRCSRRRCSSGSNHAGAGNWRTRCCRPCATSSVATSRRSRHDEPPISRRPRCVEADALVLFGATGDLSKRKLFPALYHLERHGRLNVPVIGVARSDWTDEGFRQHAHDSMLAADPDAPARIIESVCARLDLIQGDYARSGDVAGAGATPSPATGRRTPCSTWRSRRRRSRSWPARSPRSGSTPRAASSSRSRSGATWPRRWS